MSLYLNHDKMSIWTLLEILSTTRAKMCLRDFGIRPFEVQHLIKSVMPDTSTWHSEGSVKEMVARLGSPDDTTDEATITRCQKIQALLNIIPVIAVVP